MNLKNRLFLLVFLIIPAKTLCLTTQEKRAIRKELYGLVAEGHILAHQIMQINTPLLETVNQDLEIIQEHKNKLQAKIDSYKCGFTRQAIPFFNGITAAIFGFISGATGIITAVNVNTAKNLWQGTSDNQVWMLNKSVDVASKTGLLSIEDQLALVRQKLVYLNNKHPRLTAMTETIPLTAAISGITGILFLKTIFDMCTYQKRMDRQLKKAQKRWNRDQLVIIQLKNVQQSLI